MFRKTSTTGSLQVQRDHRLVRRMLAGDQRAFNEFVDEFLPKLYRYGLQRLGNHQDVEDVVQVVLATATRRIETFRGESTLLTWLVQICRHEISRHLKAAKKTDMMQPFLDDDLLRSVVESLEIGVEDNPETVVRRSELVGLIQCALDQLPEHYAQALEMKYVDGFSSREIAERLTMGDVAVQSLLARARRAFREVCSEALLVQLEQAKPGTAGGES